MKNLNIFNVIKILFEIISIGIISWLIVTIISIDDKQLLDEKNSYLMIRAANELHQSSDDLTHFARAYVVTGNEYFKDSYFNVLAIRNGDIERPKNFNSIYWDVNMDTYVKQDHTVKLSFKDITKKLPFTDEEINYLIESEKQSNNLVNLEVEAFNAMIGKYMDKNGNYTINAEANQKLAIDLMFSNEYILAKQKIMEPISKLINILEIKQTQLSRDNHQQSSNMFILFITSILIFIIGNILVYMYDNKNEEKKQKEINDALEYSRAKSMFLANMSHEIRTPLNAIVGFIKLLKKDISTKSGLEYINIIEESSCGLLKVIEDILDISKIESNKIEIDPIDFDIRKELKSIISLFEIRMSEADITPNVELSDSMPQYIHADSLRIKQVIINLIGNALKFSTPGKKITLAASIEESILTISVKDEGKGIAKDKQREIFNSFSQEDSSTTRNYGGTGLGLSISSSLVELMGGSLNLKSELGVGSEFYFSIPVGEASKDFKEVEERDTEVEFKGQKILLVEDNKSNQILMTLLLQELNLKYEIADNGLIALDMFKENKYDLVLMDENMPEMSGCESTKQILMFEKENELEHTPIIALTANSIKGDKEKFLNSGMDDYLSKPIDSTRLQKMLTNYLEK